MRSDILKQMFDFYDQISASRHYPSLEQTNLQARGIGNNINFWNQLRAICPKGVMYNGPILNSQGDHCTTSRMLDEAMLDTRKFWFVEPVDQFREWKPVLREYQTATAWPSIELPQKKISSIHCLAPRILPLALMVSHTPHGGYPLKTVILSWNI